MQFIYLLHSHIDGELAARLRARFPATFGGRRDAAVAANDNERPREGAAKYEVSLTDSEILDDLHAGRAA